MNKTEEYWNLLFPNKLTNIINEEVKENKDDKFKQDLAELPQDILNYIYKFIPLPKKSIKEHIYIIH